MWAMITAALGAIKAMFGFGQQIAQNIHDDQLRTDGEKIQQAADLSKAQQENANARYTEADVRRMPDAALDDELRHGSKPRQ